MPLYEHMDCIRFEVKSRHEAQTETCEADGLASARRTGKQGSSRFRVGVLYTPFFTCAYK